MAEYNPNNPFLPLLPPPPDPNKTIVYEMLYEQPDPDEELAPKVEFDYFDLKVKIFLIIFFLAVFAYLIITIGSG